MAQYVESAVLVYDDSTAEIREQLERNDLGVTIRAIPLAELRSDAATRLADVSHVVVCADIVGIKRVLELAESLRFAVGIVPTPQQRRLARLLDLSPNPAKAMKLALQADAQPMDLIRCNGQLLLFSAVLGWVPALEFEDTRHKRGLLTGSLRKLFNLRLLRFRIQTDEQKTIKTGASGCLIVQKHVGDKVSQIIADDASLRDAAIGLVIVSPFSVVEYLKFLFELFVFPNRQRRLPRCVGYVRSRTLSIEPEGGLQVVIDGHAKTQTPVLCECSADAVRVNLGPALQENKPSPATGKESIRIANLPDEKELARLAGGRIPFMSFASEERFRELFTALRADSRVNGAYLALMVLSTLLAAVGLYLNSAAVVIGAMILAPMMAPIVSLAMGVLRGDAQLQRNAAQKIVYGVIIALLASALLSLVFPHEPLTHEMQSRLNPTLLDLAVAVLSGIAAAYVMSYRETLQNLAGVAIAVALVPPLAVAGVGIGRFDLLFFSSAFLLFLTNLVGIVLAATFTFRILGFSPVVRAKRGVLLLAGGLAAIAVPLYLAYDDYVENYTFEQHIAKDRFLVNGKYVIVSGADVGVIHGQRVLTIDALVREPLNRHDLAVLKRKLLLYFEEDLQVQTRVRYIL